MATAASVRSEKALSNKKQKIDLTPAGLLMEGVYTQSPCPRDDDVIRAPIIR